MAQNITDTCFVDWNERETVAEAMIPMIGRLYRRNNIVTSVYGRAIINQSVIGLLKSHRFVRQVENSELSVHDTYKVLQVLDGLELGHAHIDIGKLAIKFQKQQEESSLEAFLRVELADIVDNYNAEEAKQHNEQTKDVVLYGFGRIGRLLARIMIEKAGGGANLRLRAIVVRKGKADNDLEKLVERIEQKNDAVIAFLKLHGFDDNEISRGAQSIVDKQAREYGGENQQFRYIARANITVYSSQPSKVQNALAKVSQLAKQGIAIVQDSYETRIEYLFTGLNDVKPAMVQEATEKAREVAIKFAKDSQSKLGKIKTARQGQFSISNRDSNTPQLKKVRVVTSVEYYLSD